MRKSAAFPKPSPSASVADAIAFAVQFRWRGMRSCRFNEGQAVLAFADVLRFGLGREGQYNPELFAATPLADVTTEAIRRTVSGLWLRERRHSAVAINSRLNAMSACGADVQGCRLRRPRQLKWWLNPEDAERLDRWLVDHDRVLMAEYIRWVLNTGMRVEEALAVRRKHVFIDPASALPKSRCPARRQTARKRPSRSMPTPPPSPLAALQTRTATPTHRSLRCPIATSQVSGANVAASFGWLDRRAPEH